MQGTAEQCLAYLYKNMRPFLLDGLHTQDMVEAVLADGYDFPTTVSMNMRQGEPPMLSVTFTIRASNQTELAGGRMHTIGPRRERLSYWENGELLMRNDG